MLAVVLPSPDAASISRHLQDRPGADISVDLERQALTAPGGTAHGSELDPFRKQALLNGQDEIAPTMEYAEAIAAHEAGRAAEMPWLS